MEQFAYPTFDKYESRFAVVHQVIGVDPPLDRRYRVPGSPTFVLVDHVGKEMLRFHHETTQHALEARLRPFVS
jgi:hypothetical protein